MSLIEAKNVSKSLVSNVRGASPTEVVRGFNLRLEEGDLVTFFGPNGCGKTTILNMLAGLIVPDAGKIIRNDPDCSSGFGYVFQNYGDTLLPWRTVTDNIAFPLELRRRPEEEIRARVSKRLDQFRLTEHAKKYIYELSGGLKQLVAIARATVYDPRVLLLDEPFSALDFSLSRELWLRFREFWTNQRVATIFVSHDPDEAIFLGDRVCVLSSRPARLVAEIHVPFGPHRAVSLLSSQEFFSIRAQVLEAFEIGRQQ